MQTKEMRIDKLSQDPANARKHDDRNIEAIVGSLRRFGQQHPIIVDASGVVRAGNGRLEAARRLGWETIQVIETTLTGSDATAFAIADNRTAELAEWDDEILRATLEGLRFEDEELLDAAGFTDDELTELLAELEDSGDGTTGEIIEDEVPEPPVDPITKPGDLWILGRHRVLCGDSTKAEDVGRLMDGAAPFLMVTDPPYGVEYDPGEKDKQTGIRTANSKRGKVANDDKFDWTVTYKLFPGDVCYVWHADRSGISIDVGTNIRDAGFEIRCRIIWGKSQHSFGRGHYHWQHESAWYAVKKGATSKWSGDFKQTTLWSISNKIEDHGDHGTQKPVECMARPIRNHGKQSDDVYDPFLGSGTTLIAAEQLGRTCYGMEISPQYCDVIVKRWENLTGEKAVCRSAIPE